MSIGLYDFLFWVSPIMCLINVSLGFEPVDNYLIDCGSPKNTTIGDRLFQSDNFSSTMLSTSHDVIVNTDSKSISSTIDLALYQNARIFHGTSQYRFSIKKKGWHWIRLYFFPFVDGKFDLNTAKFSVSAQNFTLLRDFRAQNGSVVKEYSLNITSDSLVLTITPFANSFAFLNALEVFNLPDELIPDGVETVDSPGKYQNLQTMALETVARVNMGNRTVSPQNDTLWRFWASDDTYLSHTNLVKFVSNILAVNYTRGWPTPNIAPSSVYGTATTLDSELNPLLNANMTWFFEVDRGFEYLVRFHFCDIMMSDNKLFFNVYMNSLLVYNDLDLSNLTSNILGAPHYMDVVTKLSNSRVISISIGPSTTANAYPNGLLNGLEIMKLSNYVGSLDEMDLEIKPTMSRSKKKVWVILGPVIGVLFIAVIFSLVLFLVCRRRRRRRRGLVGHSTPDNFPMNGGENSETMKSKFPVGNAIFSRSKIGYRFPLLAIQEATDNFNENLVIGVGGFGTVYKGVLRDETKVAVKRGVYHSNQGLAEFRTEIEMLSHFRHRHLVSLIGYCDDKNEMIIIYEYMENGTLKNHLYDSDLPHLSWRQRLEICIGSARGLHYLHTGSAKAIIHRDVKSANILLDENLMAKVSDFGLSKTGPEIDQTHVSTMVKGSFGYLDPEYLTTQQLTEKSDVYSFGVVMFEILCGRPVIDPSLPREKINLIEWALKWQKRGELEKIVDPRLADQVNSESLRKFGEIAEKCLAEHTFDRPAMGDVLWNLECALQLQGNEERANGNGEVSNNHFQRTVSTTEFSVGSAGDLAGVSMSRVFSEMVKAEMR